MRSAIPAGPRQRTAPLPRRWKTLGGDGKSHVTRSRISFHALRHSHVSALIAAGVDVVTISQRIAHANPAVTLAVYAHLFAGSNKDAAAALAIDAAMGAKRQLGANRVPILVSFFGSVTLSCWPALPGGVAEWLKAAGC